MQWNWLNLLKHVQIAYLAPGPVFFRQKPFYICQCCSIPFQSSELGFFILFCILYFIILLQLVCTCLVPHSISWLFHFCTFILFSFFAGAVSDLFNQVRPVIIYWFCIFYRLRTNNFSSFSFYIFLISAGSVPDHFNSVSWAK